MEELASSSIDHICRVLEFFLPDENSRQLYAFVFDLRSFAGRLGPSGAVTAIFFFPRVSGFTLHTSSAEWNLFVFPLVFSFEEAPLLNSLKRSFFIFCLLHREADWTIASGIEDELLCFFSTADSETILISTLFNWLVSTINPFGAIRLVFCLACLMNSYVNYTWWCRPCWLIS